ncbi:DUF4865 family protein [Streptomyces sp. NPDC049813]|uniref:DUF4865 family protein n=1 Tax=Streptomyces sp. NPDC049813 TaxID=3365597 RepID=UPI00379995E6
MYAMQYEITLPAAHDMGLIRARVAARGHLLDDFPGLGIKAYLMRERGVGGSPVNQYAPFYLWNSPRAMNSFLWGSGFQGIVQDFGRPSVRHWTGVAYEEGRAASGPVRTAVRRRTPIAEDAELPALMAASVDDTARLAAADGAVLAATAVDPDRWQLVTFSLWDHDAPEAPGDLCQVLHLSQPGRASLAHGRQW